LNFNID